MHTQNQFQLLNQRRFLPFFCAQLLGAFNDNLFRSALILLIAFSMPAQAKYLTNFASALFILPFLLFGPIAGQMADKFDKASLIRYIKFFEILIALSVGLGLYYENLWVLLGVLFLMGAQSAFFGPAKYSYLPEHLAQQELVGANGLVEMGTFVAIILGTTLGGILFSLQSTATLWITGMVFLLACLGFFASCFIPYTPPPTPDLRLDWHVIRKGWEIYQYTKKRRVIFLSIVGISWFWGMGIFFLTQIPYYVITYIRGDARVTTLFLAIFSIGIGLGSVLCEKLSSRKIEVGLVPFGAIGLSVFMLDLAFAHTRLSAHTDIFTLTTFWHTTGATRLMLDLLGMGIFAGFYVVPLYAIVQHRSNPKRRAQVIAFNNILNTLFMIGISCFSMVAYAFTVSTPGLILCMAITNILISVYIFKLVPEFLLRFLGWMLVRTLYKIRYHGTEHIPEKGPAVLICNHESYVDPFIILSGCMRPIRFVMDQKFYYLPLLNFFCKYGKAIPISSAAISPKSKEQAFERISEALQQGELVCIFPEGKMTRDGHLAPFKPGIRQIIERHPVPIIPLCLRGLWGSFFSYHKGKLMRGFSKHIPFFYPVNLYVGDAIAPDNLKVAELEARIEALKQEAKKGVRI